MKIIAHRGNIDGPSKDENKPSVIDEAITLGYEVELDLRILNNELYLGHDEPTYLIDIDFLLDRLDKLWIHCKDIESLIYCTQYLTNANYFWHQEDDYTLTSKNYIWVYPAISIPTKSKCICVLPEVNDQFMFNCQGICTDYANAYKEILNL